MSGSTVVKGFLGSEKAPFIVTLFIAALSWTAIHTSERLSSTPFVEYRIAPTHSESGVQGIEIRLRNITASSRFDCFGLTLVTRRQETLKFGDAKSQQHHLRGTVFASLTVKQAKDNEWGIDVANLSPGADIALFVPTSGDGSPVVLASSCPSVPVMPKGGEKGDADKGEKPAAAVPVLIQRSFTTFFVEYEITILWGALVAWLALMLFLMWPSPPAKRKRRGSLHGGRA